MTTLRFTPPTSGPLANAGLITVASNWSPAQAPMPGDTAIITGGTMQTRSDLTPEGVAFYAPS